MPRIPLIEDLTKEPVPTGSNLLVEFDPASQWYAASLSVTAGWLRTGGLVCYTVSSQPPDNIRRHLNRLGLNAEKLEGDDKLWVFDWYTVTLGQKSKEKFGVESLKVADLSIYYGKLMKDAEPIPDFLWIIDNLSSLARYNDERAWVEFMVTRVIPTSSIWKSTGLLGINNGVHSDWAYKTLEANGEGIIDFKLDEASNETRDLVRIRNMRNVGFDRLWHPLKIGKNFEVTLDM